jgi:hypothetical protein
MKLESNKRWRMKPVVFLAGMTFFGTALVAGLYTLLNFSQKPKIIKIRYALQSQTLNTQSVFKEKRLLEEINIRDPFLIKDKQGGYILTGTLSQNQVSIYKSQDKKIWSGPFVIVPEENIPFKTVNTWAPEIHEIKGGYYLLVTHMGEDLKRGSYLYQSDSVDGEYTFVNRITPDNKMSLDATFLMQEDGLWVTYCHEWLEAVDGKICAVKMEEDMSGIDLTTDTCLFNASDNIFQSAFSWQNLVTDGPWYIQKNNDLYMMWSTYTWNYRYIQVLAKSSNGKINGDWQQLGVLYKRDGGHGMIFTDYDGEQYLVLHSPNGKYVLFDAFEHTKIIPFTQTNFQELIQ